MFKELATIKNGKEIVGFVVHEEATGSLFIKTIEEAKETAASGNMDTLYYADGKFIPIIQGKLAKELRRKFMLRKYEKVCERMTFEEFVAADCIFEKKDVDMMLTHKQMVLVNVCLAFNITIGNVSSWFLTMAFWSDYPETMDRVKSVLSEYAPYIKTIRTMREHDGRFIMMNLPLRDPKSGFDLLELQKKTGLSFVYNMKPVENMNERISIMTKIVPGLFRKIINRLKPTDKALEELKTAMIKVNLNSTINELDKCMSTPLGDDCSSPSERSSL